MDIKVFDQKFFYNGEEKVKTFLEMITVFRVVANNVFTTQHENTGKVKISV